MTERTARLRRQSLDARPSISAERALLVTRFYQAESGRHSTAVTRASEGTGPPASSTRHTGAPGGSVPRGKGTPLVTTSPCRAAPPDSTTVSGVVPALSE